jgi:uncharacterized SAM-binding protein YcdF (DUF218 family)
MNTNHDESLTKNRRPWFQSLLMVVSIAAYPSWTLVNAWQFGDTLVLQKVASKWLFPGGLLTMIGILTVVIAIANRQKLLTLLGIVLLLMCASASDPVTKWIVSSLEDQYPDLAAEEIKRCDTIVVLGGCTSITPAERPQLSIAGERICLAARLYHAGKADKVIVTGDELIETKTEFDSPQAQGRALLEGLGVAASDIETLSGRNTLGELTSLKAAPEYWQSKRCGLVTSAIHMPRAMKLAASFELDLIPIPADYQQPNDDINPMTWVPRSDNFGRLSSAMHEYLGMLMGR